MALRQNFAVDLLTNASAGAGTAHRWPGGLMAITSVAAAYGTGDTDIQLLGPDGSTWVDIADLAISANGVKTAYVPAGMIRANAGATASGVYIRAVAIPL